MNQFSDTLKNSISVQEEDHNEIGRIWDFFQEYVNE